MKSDQIAIKASGDVISRTSLAEIFVGCTREVKTASGEIAPRVHFDADRLPLDTFELAVLFGSGKPTKVDMKPG